MTTSQGHDAIGSEQQGQCWPGRQQARSLLIFDADCRLCTTVKDRLERAGAEQHVRFVPYQSAEAAERLGALHRPGRPEAAFLLDADGRLRRGLDAFLPLASLYPGGRVLQRLLAWGPCYWLAERLYRWTARHRYRMFGTVRAEPPSDQ